jgi:hypothetical protein
MLTESISNNIVNSFMHCVICVVPVPHHLRSETMESSDARVERAVSVSSTRRMNLPPSFRAYSQLNSAVRAPPTCRLPAGTVPVSNPRA